MTNKILAQAHRAREAVDKAQKAISAGDKMTALRHAVEAAEEAQEFAFQMRACIRDDN